MSAEAPDSKQEQEEAQPELLCLICHDDEIDEYIILPNCKQPHTFCYDCGEHLEKNAKTKSKRRRGGGGGDDETKKYLACPLCSRESALPAVGVKGWKRRTKPRAVNIVDGKCETHPDEVVSLVCRDCLDVLCFSCAADHADHRCETLDDAKEWFATKMREQSEALQTTRAELGSVVETGSGSQEKVKEEGEKALAKVKEDLAKLRETFEKKVAEVEAAYERLVETKLSELESESATALERVDKLDTAITATTSVLEKTEALDMFLEYYKVEPQLVEATGLTAPTNLANVKWPTVQTQYVADALVMDLKVSKTGGMGYSDYDDEDDWFSDEYDDYEY